MKHGTMSSALPNEAACAYLKELKKLTNVYNMDTQLNLTHVDNVKLKKLITHRKMLRLNTCR